MNFKKNQLGQISGGVFAMIVVAVMFAVVLFSWMSAHNRANSFEHDLKKSYEGSQITLSACTTDIRNITKLPDKYVSQLKDVINAEMNGRYGGQSTDRVAKFIQERALNFDNSMLRDVQNKISACETTFAQNQKMFVEIREEYQKALGSFWGGMFMRMAGFPKIDLNQFKAILDKSSKEQFESGERQDYDINIK